ncbi:MAG TPA: hypothetical protein VGH38_14145 [Bryobacteraceae bacterium]|jgi:hypothetical protein
MFVLLGTTCGDDLRGPETQVLGAGDHEDLLAEARRLTDARDEWLAENTPLPSQAGSIYARFEVMQVPEV